MPTGRIELLSFMDGMALIQPCPDPCRIAAIRGAEFNTGLPNTPNESVVKRANWYP